MTCINLWEVPRPVKKVLDWWQKEIKIARASLDKFDRRSKMRMTKTITVPVFRHRIKGNKRTAEARKVAVTLDIDLKELARVMGHNAIYCPVGKSQAVYGTVRATVDRQKFFAKGS